PPLFPYTTLFRSGLCAVIRKLRDRARAVGRVRLTFESGHRLGDGADRPADPFWRPGGTETAVSAASAARASEIAPVRRSAANTDEPALQVRSRQRPAVQVAL